MLKEVTQDQLNVIIYGLKQEGGELFIRDFKFF